jgi:hypothetical protein|tara:strand:- start:1388 stop:1543 length:156 start_codon:yes stop_codon:yes gene_type:complete
VLKAVPNLKKRYKNFVAWYKKLRADGYLWHNCVEWAIYNSGSHNIDGTYFK